MAISGTKSVDQEAKSRFFLLLRKALCSVILAYSAIHFIVICRTAVDIPYLDEMELFVKDGIILGWSKDFIFNFFMDHRIVLTKIVYLLNYDLFHLNFRYQIIFIAICQIVLGWTVWVTVVRKVGGGKSVMAILAFLPFLSTLHVESHSRAITVGKHLSLLALVGGTYLLFHRKGLRYFFLGISLLAIAFLGSSSGVGGVAAVCTAYVIWSVIAREKGFLFRSLFVFAAAFFGIFVTFQGFHKVSIHPAFTYPWTIRFPRFMAENISLGFGFTDLNPYLSFLCFYLVLSALIVSIWFVLKQKREEPQTVFLIAFTLGILGMVASVTFGRGGFSLWNAKMSRYAEVSVFFPLLAVALFQSHPRAARLGSCWVLLLLGIGLTDNFGFSEYRAVAESRREGVRCVRELLGRPEDNPSGICPTLYPTSIRERMERAEKLEVSFTRN